MKRIAYLFLILCSLFSLLLAQEQTTWSNEDVLGESAPDVTEATVSVSTEFVQTNHSKAGAEAVKALQLAIKDYGVKVVTRDAIVYNAKGQAMRVVQRIIIPSIDLADAVRRSAVMSDATKRIVSRSLRGGFQAVGYIGDIGIMAYEIAVAENDTAIAHTVISTLVSSALISAAAYAIELAIPGAGIPMYISTLVANITAEIVISIVVDLVVRAIVYEVAD